MAFTLLACCHFFGSSPATPACVWIYAGDGRGSLRRGLCQRRLAVQKHKDSDTKKRFSFLIFLTHTDTRWHDTCKPIPAYASQASPYPGTMTARPAFRCPRRHAHHADHTLPRMQTEWLPHNAQAFATFRFPVSRMFTRCRRHTCHQRAGYDSVSRPIRSRHIPDARTMRLCFRTDACSFVRPCRRRPAYVSYRRSASYCTAGEGRRPFEPRKPKGGKTVKRVKPVRKAAVILRVYPEERDIPRFNAALHGRPTTSTHYAKKHDRRHKRQDTPPALFLRCGLGQGRFLISYKSL